MPVQGHAWKQGVTIPGACTASDFQLQADFLLQAASDHDDHPDWVIVSGISSILIIFSACLQVLPEPTPLAARSRAAAAALSQAGCPDLRLSEDSEQPGKTKSWNLNGTSESVHWTSFVQS